MTKQEINKVIEVIKEKHFDIYDEFFKKVLYQYYLEKIIEECKGDISCIIEKMIDMTMKYYDQPPPPPPPPPPAPTSFF